MARRDERGLLHRAAFCGIQRRVYRRHTSIGPGLGDVGPATIYAGMTDSEVGLQRRDATRSARDFYRLRSVLPRLEAMSHHGLPPRKGVKEVEKSLRPITARSCRIYRRAGTLLGAEDVPLRHIKTAEACRTENGDLEASVNGWHADPNLALRLSDAQVSTIADSADIIYVLDTTLTIRAHNAAYVEFGVGNGCPGVARDFGIGCSLLTVLDGAVGEFYIPAYSVAMERNLRFDHDYECSSPRVFRRFHQSAYPLAAGQGLVVSHHLVYEYPHVWQAQGLKPRHFDEGGWLAQCACCRKLKDHSAPDKWDWVPRLVDTPHPRAAVTYCGNCRAFYYCDTVEWAPARPEGRVSIDAAFPEAASGSRADAARHGSRWILYTKLFGGWGWEQLDDNGVLVAESKGDFPTRALCEADARAHGWLGGDPWGGPQAASVHHPRGRE